MGVGLHSMVYNGGNFYMFGGSYLENEGFDKVYITNINNKCPNNCNNNGICNKQFGCKCNKGYFLKDCSLQMKCAKSCNNGYCSLDNKCECNKGWKGNLS